MQLRLVGLFRFEVVALQFDVEPPVEQRRQTPQARPRQIEQAVGERAVDRARRPAGQRDQAVGLAERVETDMRLVAVGRGEPDLRGEPHQVAIARLVLGDEHDRRARRARVGAPTQRRRRVAKIERDLRADDRLDAGLRQLFGKFQRAEQVVGVGDRQSRHLVGLGEPGERLDRQRAFAQRIGGMDVQVHEADGFDQRVIHNNSSPRHRRRPAPLRRGSPARRQQPITRRAARATIAIIARNAASAASSAKSPATPIARRIMTASATPRAAPYVHVLFLSTRHLRKRLSSNGAVGRRGKNAPSVSSWRGGGRKQAGDFLTPTPGRRLGVHGARHLAEWSNSEGRRLQNPRGGAALDRHRSQRMGHALHAPAHAARVVVVSRKYPPWPGWRRWRWGFCSLIFTARRRGRTALP